MDGRDASRFPFSQPQFKPRERFRAPQYDDTVDDGPYGLSESMQLDSFDDRVLQQQHPQPRQGPARLSLAPGPSKFFSGPGNEVTYQPRRYTGASQSQMLGANRQYDEYRCDEPVQERQHAENPLFARGQLNRFAYNADGPEESSSDVSLGPSCSPALKADQRRAEVTPLTSTYRASGASMFQNERHDNGAPYNQRHERPFQPVTPARSRPFEVEQPEHEVSQRAVVAQHNVQPHAPRPQPRPMDLPHAPPMCRGIPLVPVSTLPDRLRTVFPYPTFNAVQSKCFDKVFRSDDNFVLASPTGSGKTVILELALCRAIATNATGQYKVVYQAPTKALCAERQRDWEAKFTPIGLKCAELTGDSDASDMRNVQSANIIVTTPEKWDSITRKWKDHEKLMRLIKLFLIDEVHILKENRGAVLEAVVSRMKSIGTDVRFVALSATVPNFHDVAAWLGRDSSDPHTPAANEKFGEEFRPVKLRKHVCGYHTNSNNDFVFEKFLDSKLTEVIAKYSEGKPIMVFCATRASCVKTAQLVANWWLSRPGQDRKWAPPTKQMPMLNKDLRETVPSGVAFHHAGLDPDDRTKVEKGFLDHEISVICCTSTLAVGVNLPCHLVIVKNTVTFTNEGMQEYSDLEMMQMLGRAGRPQFDDTAVAVIMTRQAKARRYELMVTGQDLLESKLHLNLIDHMNAEIGLGTIRDLVSARKWLTGTFLYVRLQQNPNHYKLEGSRAGQDIEEQVDDICFRDISLLREHSLVSGEEYFRCTEYGHAMARYYVHFDTMKVLLGIQPKATPSEILSAVAQASEFSQLRFRGGEKPVYKLLNKSPSIRFSIPVNLDLPAHKVSLIIQSVLGSADISWDGEAAKHKTQYTAECAIVFKNISSLVRCIIDCQIYLGDSISIHSALMIERSLGARAWDDSPLQLKQVEGIGAVAVRKFVNAGIRSIEDLEAAGAHRIETLIGRNPPFGMKVLEAVKAFPKLRVSLHVQSSSVTKCTEGVKIQVKAEIGFMNEKPPQRFGGKLVYVCLLAESSNGRKIHFARISGPKLGTGQSLTFPAVLTSQDQSINCYVMCDSIAGSLRGASVKPKIAPSMFPAPKSSEPNTPQPQPNTSKRRAEPAKSNRRRSTTSDDFGDDGIDDDELMKVSVGDLEFDHIDNFANPMDAITRKNTAKNKAGQTKTQAKAATLNAEDDYQEPVQMANGKWACNHKCKDKNICKHLCCREGTDKRPRKPAPAKNRAANDDEPEPSQRPSTQKAPQKQSKLQLTASKRKISSAIEEIDLSQQEKKKKADYAHNGPRDYRDLHQLHKNVQKKDPPSSLHAVMHKKPAYSYSEGGEHNLSFLQPPKTMQSDHSSDYGDITLEDVSPHYEKTQRAVEVEDLVSLSDDMDANEFGDCPATAPVPSRGSDTFGDDDSLLGDAMIGLADSQNLQDAATGNQGSMDRLEEAIEMEYEASFRGDDTAIDMDMDMGLGNDFDDVIDWQTHDNESAAPATKPSKVPVQKPRATFIQDSSSDPPHPVTDNDSQVPFTQDTLNDPPRPVTNKKPAKPAELAELRQPAAPPRNKSSTTTKSKADIEEIDVLDLLDDFEDAPPVKEVPDAYSGLESWLFHEFGDVVELEED